MKTMILTLFGEKIPWMDEYLKNTDRISETNDIKWLIFSDKGYGIHMEFGDFLALYEDKMGMRLDFNPYGPKHWDIRPAYGVIFSDYLKDSESWGHTDHDCVYGNVDKFVGNDWEMWTNDPYPTICGHFTLYKNTEKVNNLFREYPLWKEMMSKEDSHILTRPLSGNLSPMSWTTKKLVDEGKLSVKYDFSPQSNDKQEHKLEWKDGLYSDGREVMVHHFRQGKQWPSVQF